MQSTETLHVCPYYPEHRIHARKLYGINRVNEQLKKDINYCNDCAMFPDLLLYLGIDKDVNVKVPNDGYDTDYMFVKVKTKNKSNDITRGKKEMVYRERLLQPDDFFEPPENGKRWLDYL